MMSEKDKKEKFQNAMFVYAQNNYGEAIDLLTHLVNGNGDDKLSLFARGSAYLKLDKLEEAVIDFDKSLEIDSNYARAYHLRGLAKVGMGNQKEALENFNRAIELDPEYGAAYYSRATLHTQMGNEDLAVEDAEMVTHLTNKSVEEFANESNIWRSQHLRLEAMVDEMGATLNES